MYRVPVLMANGLITTSGVAGTSVATDILAAAGVGFHYRIAYFVVAGNSSIGAGARILAQLQSAGVLPPTLTISDASPYAPAEIPEPGLLFGDNGKVTINHQCNQASQNLFWSLGYFLELT